MHPREGGDPAGLTPRPLHCARKESWIPGQAREGGGRGLRAVAPHASPRRRGSSCPSAAAANWAPACAGVRQAGGQVSLSHAIHAIWCRVEALAHERPRFPTQPRSRITPPMPTAPPHTLTAQNHRPNRPSATTRVFAPGPCNTRSIRAARATNRALPAPLKPPLATARPTAYAPRGLRGLRRALRRDSTWPTSP